MSHQQHRRQQDSTSTSRRGPVASAVPSLAWLSSIIASMTRPLHHASAMSPQQRGHQHDSTSTSYRSQVTLAASSPAWLSLFIWPQASCLYSVITSMTWHLHLAMAKSPRPHCRQHELTSTSCRGQVASATSLPTWLSSTVPSKTRHLHCIMAKSPW
jgi:hypothetical protein